LLIDRIYLRNYRVFEDELDLDLPPGLVGVYGPNGAGKSTLIESIVWALWGRARTPKEEIPSAGADSECVAQVTFEHEGHLYVVRRTISGANATVRARAHCDGMAMSEGPRDTGRYMHSVLGMDDAAFRSSVFAEQKQLAAFSGQSPAERRKLVLSLLGVTPLDVARDKARTDAREVTQQHSRLRAMLPDIQSAAVAAADAEARAGAAEATAIEEESAAAAAHDRLRRSTESFARLDRVRQEHALLVVEGKAARTEHAAAGEELARLSGELASLAEARARLARLQPLAARAPAAERRARLLGDLAGVATELAAAHEVAPPPAPIDGALDAAEQVAMAARTALGSAQAGLQSARAELERAERAANQSASLSDKEDCPLCGQALGDAFAAVQAHRSLDLRVARQRMESARGALERATAASLAAAEEHRRLSAAASAARQARAGWEQECTRQGTLRERLAAALGALAGTDEQLARSLGPTPATQALAEARAAAQKDLELCRQAQDEAGHLEGRLERSSAAELALHQAQERAAAAAALLDALRAKVKGLGYDPAAVAVAQSELREAEMAAAHAGSAARNAQVLAASARTRAEAEAKRLAEARAQHALLGDLESASVHLGRTAELLNGFRNSVVASVGPRLGAQAAELFGELTDNEYDRLEVDPETYGLQIADGGVSYDLERFSGSEVDLANLALRVAISEHVRLLSGGSVGLLVLDEVFGPLDEERSARMLLALEHLRGRFRQILVVTHSSDIKDRLPSAIEVRKRPNRRATARVIGPDGY